MQVMFECRDPEATQVRSLAQRRVRFALRRLSWLVPRAHVRLSDINGPRGGVDKRCQIELDSNGAPPVLVTAVARDWRAAIDECVTRAARALLRVWRRSHRHQTRAVSTSRLFFAEEQTR